MTRSKMPRWSGGNTWLLDGAGLKSWIRRRENRCPARLGLTWCENRVALEKNGPAPGSCWLKLLWFLHLGFLDWFLGRFLSTRLDLDYLVRLKREWLRTVKNLSYRLIQPV